MAQRPIFSYSWLALWAALSQGSIECRRRIHATLVSAIEKASANNARRFNVDRGVVSRTVFEDFGFTAPTKESASAFFRSNLPSAVFQLNNPKDSKRLSGLIETRAKAAAETLSREQCAHQSLLDIVERASRRAARVGMVPPAQVSDAVFGRLGMSEELRRSSSAFFKSDLAKKLVAIEDRKNPVRVPNLIKEFARAATSQLAHGHNVDHSTWKWFRSVVDALLSGSKQS